jgi:hypothetical protein
MTDLQLLVRSINIRLQNLYTTFCCKVNTCLGISPTGDASLVLNQQGDWVSGGGGRSSYKVYTALITQSGLGGDPTVEILENTIGPIVWTWSSTGIYGGLLNAAFTNEKTWVSISPLVADPLISPIVFELGAIFRKDSDKIIILTDGDSKLLNTSIEIRVYN